MNNFDKIKVVGSYQPPNCTSLGQRYEVYSIYGCMGTLTATEYKQPKSVIIKLKTEVRNGKL